MTKQFAIGCSTKVKTYSFGSTSVLGNGLENTFYIGQVLYITTLRLEIKSILDTLFNSYNTGPDIKIFWTVNKSSYWIIIHLRITQGVKTHANLKLKFKFRSQPQTTLQSQPQRSTTGSGSQPIVTPLQKSQRVSTSTRASEAVVPQQATRSLRA